MDDLENCLTDCFITVFQKLQEAEVTSTSMATFKERDSLRMIILVVVIEKEFEVTVSVDEIENLTSFQTLHDYLDGLSAQRSPTERSGGLPQQRSAPFQACPGDSDS